MKFVKWRRVLLDFFLKMKDTRTGRSRLCGRVRGTKGMFGS